MAITKKNQTAAIGRIVFSVARIRDGVHYTAQVRKNAEWDEFRVFFLRDGGFRPEETYFTSELSDAQDTAKNWIEEQS